ncbi:16S rRNA (adenine(1518)-N(6)/adenine(1519)-N(6))-dimethyltransferase RsmA [Lawsonibacter sp. JLR.KK007]|uniref:16S rRNA (adenine(1518)-N(6)/adenine(1519)-N(6))- dimethyltransferase RsmA n=1 Tax=Lawsonibacter sp. JLR.KK007 TaxID=3114293 RepID=UPI002FF33737
MNLCDINQIKSLLARHGFRFSKSMGQNFLIADWVPREIAKASRAHPDTGVLEIGPGIGCLTQELAGRAGKVVSVELDKALLPILEETLAGRDNVEIVPGDILKLDIRQMTRDMPWLSGFAACANLPYNITTPAITALIEAQCFFAITVMIQKEVAQRICAQPGTKDYGAFSVFCQYHTAPELLFEVPPDCFLPAPKVTSAVVRMVPRPVPAEVDDPDHFFRVVKAAFALRRKTLLNSLAANLDRPREDILRALEACGVPPDTRGERLSIPQFAQLSKALRGLI